MNNIRLKYKREQSVKYISHLDLLRTFNRAFKRARIDVTYTQGFNPRPKLSFALPLSVGTTSETEYMDFEVDSDMACEDYIKKLNDVLPKGIKVIKAQYIEDKGKSIASKIYLADYKVKIILKEKVNDNISDIIYSLLQKDELIVEKQSKRGMRNINIISKIHKFDINEVKDNCIIITLRLDAGSVSNLNPQLVLEGLEKYIENFIIDYAEIHRLSLLYKDGNNIF